MATITVRNLSESVVQSLKELAHRNHRSMEHEAREIISHFVMDRNAAMKRIEATWKEHKRKITRNEAEEWCKKSFTL